VIPNIRPRLEKILDLYGQALAEAVGQREPTSQQLEIKLLGSQSSAQDLIRRFADMDPTPGKSRTQWMIQTYITDTYFKLEDLGRAHAALAAFERFKRKLPREQREINYLKTLSTLEALVDPFVKAEAKARLERDLSTATGRELRRLECVKARDESIIIQEGEGLPTIAVPMTEFASCWWGRGTKWCTAANKKNVFNEYNEDAPLVIIICSATNLQSSRSGDKSLSAKFQAYVTKNFIQFMDETDTKVDSVTVQERWNEFQSLICWMITQNGRVIQYVPEECRTPELCLMAVKQYGGAFDYVPEDKMTQELCFLAVEQNGCALSSVPRVYKTPELCRLAVEQNGMALQFVPGGHRNLELCYLAIEQDGRALQYVSVKYRTPEFCRMAVKQDGRALQFVPHDLNSSIAQIDDLPANARFDFKCVLELCRLAVEQNGWALGFIPKEHRTLELCRIAIQHSGEVLKYVPEELKTPELCRLAIEQDGAALYHVPKDYKTPELCRLAVKQNANALKLMPEELKTPELLALITPSQPNWHPDILQSLYPS
jgi:Domain of unknown function (DUF4116)